MTRFIIRRLWQAALTILGVMLITFLLFRHISGDIAAANLGEKATTERRASWLHRHGYDRPMLANFLYRQLMIVDGSTGPGQFDVRDGEDGNAVYALGLFLSEAPGQAAPESPTGRKTLNTFLGRYVWRLSPQTPLAELADHTPLVAKARPAAAAPAGDEGGQQSSPAPADRPSPAPASAPGAPGAPAASAPRAPAPASRPTSDTGQGQVPAPPGAGKPALVFSLADGSKVRVDLEGADTTGDIVSRINSAPDNPGVLVAGITQWRAGQFFDSQFFLHLRESATFQARSLKDNRKLTDLIAERAPASLSVQIPAFAIEWIVALIISCFVAYYRDSLIDKAGVFLTVLGMCIPFLAFMIYGQWLMFLISPAHAYGVLYRANVYVPIAIMVIGGLGSQVRFYRTIILDETNRDYVRTAMAKGLPLTSVLFKHVLKNCMLPILTSLILTIPFLMMGGLLVENYFGIPGLGDLMITSIQDRNEPIMSALVFLTALIYTLGVLLTDICYAIFDPRIRLR